MTSRITELEAPSRFVDQQVKRQFKTFHHLHEFYEQGQETVMVYTITLASPIGGRLAERLILVPYVRRLIRTRNEYLLAALDED